MRGARLALVCTGAFFCVSVAGAQDPYTDFRIPEARSFTWLVRADARGSDIFLHDSGRQHELRTADAGLLSSAHHHAESEPRTSDLFLSVSGNWFANRQSDVNTFPGFLDDRDDDADRATYRASGSAATTHYLGGSRWGIDAGATATYEYMRFANTQQSRFGAGTGETRNSFEFAYRYYHAAADLALGPGFGRVRDVTGVFDMQVLEQRLEDTGRLAHPLSPAARQRLAELFSVANDFQAAHDRPDRYLWRDVERILREDGAIAAGTFDAWSLMRALEPATLSIAVLRRAGWRVSGAYELRVDRGHADSDNRVESVTFLNGVPTSSSSSLSSSRRSLDDEQGFAVLDADVHRPLGMRWQADLSGALRYGDGPRRRLIASYAAGLSYVLADRWLATAAFSEVSSSEQIEGARSSPGWTILGAGQLSYFFEDSWSVFASVDHQQARPLRSINDTPLVPDGFWRQTQVQFGLTYRPSGRFEAPGLGVSERLAPGGV
jgi:hypothetical protein